MNQTIVCPTCGNKIETGINFQPSYCSKCGTNIDNEYKSEYNYCPKCCPDGPTNAYENLDLDDKYCPMCGEKTILYDEIIFQNN